MPYRERRQERARAPAKSALVLRDLVRQFSDPYACLRELVQNSIDAGATCVRVVVEREGDLLRTSVTDDGAGMSLELIQGPFLTKFVSTKEGDSSKIGKYGVGFLSVFALEPQLVVVETERDGQAFAIQLAPDFSFEVRRATPRGASGTTVTIVQSGVADEAQHRARAKEALMRWCRHAKLAIEWRDQGTSERIDRPLGLVAPVVVEHREEGLHVLVGPAAGTEHVGGDKDGGTSDFAGFYSRGLTLIEATVGEHVRSAIRFKVEATELSHTISRDDVIRNRAYAGALARVDELAKRPLRERLRAELQRAAERSAELGELEVGFVALLAAARVWLPPEEIMLPLVESGAARNVTSLEALARASERGKLLVATARSELTRAAIERGYWVVLASLAAGLALPQRPVEELLRQAALSSPPRPFVDALLRALAQIDVAVTRVLVTADRDLAGNVALRVPESQLLPNAERAAAVVLPPVDAKGPCALLLFTAVPAVAALLASPDPERAALLCARLVHLAIAGELSRAHNLALLEASLPILAEAPR